MKKQYDVYVTDEGKGLVYGRGEIPEYGCLPDRKPVYKSETEDEWREWLSGHADWRDGKGVRVCRRRGTFDAAFAKDLEAKAQALLDGYRKRGAGLGWGGLRIDKSWTIHTYRASADWKNEPTRYTFDQRLAWENPPESWLDTDALYARDEYVRLVGMADAAHELGLDLVFDENFKVSVVGMNATWEAEYES